ncbi:hypothetical protein [Winogradskya humida]|uniref:Uncharacterized protein n=1 Tax=Winogradskya humida TaxID=113566 RepID=A0ABQ3ZYR4_9ACTN|nr:hypothetical protein [Actinoplanes humidus]GIE23688.1 hypothetical protein Ahu01nite_067900 [Actinoplanes humidus]
MAGLALLAVPRVILHDLDILEEGTFVNLLFVVVPPMIWIAVALAARVPRPFLTLLAVGAFYGVFLCIAHQLLWDVSGGHDVRLGGNLEGRLSPGTEQLMIRIFAAVSGIFTGLLVGAITGLIAWGGRRLLTKREKA